MRILVLKGKSQYNALNYTADYIVNAWKQMNIEVIVVDLVSDTACENLIKAIQEELDFVFSFQGYGLIVKTIDDKYLFEVLNKKFIAFIGDHPIYHSGIIQLGFEHLKFITIDQSHCSYIKKYYEGTINATTVSNLGLIEANLIKPYGERTIELYFPGSYENPQKCLDNIQQDEEWLKTISTELIKRLLEHTGWTLERALEEYLKEIEFDLSAYDFRVLLMNQQDADKYVRAYFRDKCIRTLCENGVKVTVCGNGWEKFRCNDMNNLEVIGNGESLLEEGLEIINNSKIVLNISPWFKYGCSGREGKVFGNGALYLTDHCQWLDENFVDGEDILFYSLDNIEKITSIVKDILNDDTRAEYIIKNAKGKAVKLFSWEKLAQEIIEVAEVNVAVKPLG